MHVEGYVKCMQTKFGGHGLSDCGDLTPLIYGQFSLLDHELL